MTGTSRCSSVLGVDNGFMKVFGFLSDDAYI